jgi:hypothetical protein
MALQSVPSVDTRAEVERWRWVVGGCANGRAPELEYTPDVSDLHGLVVATAAQRVPLVGGDEIVGLAADEVHLAEPPDPVAASGARQLPSVSP